jgi:hypothetical protein
MADPARRPDDYPIENRPGGKVPAWAVSMLLHVVLIIALALWLDRGPSGQGNLPDRAVGVAVAHRMADRTVYETVEAENSDTESESNDADSAAAAAAASTAPSAAQPIDVDGLLAAITDTPMPDSGQGTGSALEAGDGAGSGPMTDGEGGGPKASTMFFGASGSGRRFAYVFDRSDSMNGKPLNAVKSELLRSLDLLRWPIVPSYLLQQSTFLLRSRRLYDAARQRFDEKPREDVRAQHRRLRWNRTLRRFANGTEPSPRRHLFSHRRQHPTTQHSRTRRDSKSVCRSERDDPCDRIWSRTARTKENVLASIGQRQSR